MGYLLSIPAVLLMLALGLGQMWLGWLGLEHHLGGWAAWGSVALAVIVRIMLPLSIGSYFGAVDVLGWPWWGGVLVAVPGIVFMIPAVVVGLVATVTDQFRSNK